MSDKNKKTVTKIKIANSFKVYISRCINSDFQEGDIERGFTKIVTRTIGGFIYYKRPPKDKIVKAIVKKRDLKFLDDKHKETLPDLIYFV